LIYIGLPLLSLSGPSRPPAPSDLGVVFLDGVGVAGTGSLDMKSGEETRFLIALTVV
jgi:hypothetical protein